MSKDLEIDWNSTTRTYINTTIEDHSIPLHPYYANLINPKLKIGDLVETPAGRIGLVKEIDLPNNATAMFIRGANNQYYRVLIGNEDKVYVGYSLKKINKKLDTIK
tara:strand:+ start:859 stop:1176 length:318 start_codon:yes stop_codon:yes gene_type:complete